MKVFQLNPTENPQVSLGCFVHTPSPEMPNCAVRPAVLVVPGGAYNMCSDREAEPVALAYAARGYHAFVLRYSVGSEVAFPQPLRDAEAALELILANAGEWGVDPARIAAVGFSAGGHLVAALGTMGRVRPAALVLCYPCIMKSTEEVLHRPVPGLDEKVDGETPPTFIFSTFEDDAVPVENSLAFASALVRNRVGCELHIFQQGVHGLSLAQPFTSGGSPRLVNERAAQWLELSAQWLQERFY